MVIDKPLSRLLPELHEDNNEHYLNDFKCNSSNKFKIRKNKNIKKENIMSDNFKF